MIDRAGRSARAMALCLVAAAGCARVYMRENPSTGIGFMLGALKATLDAEPRDVAAATERAFEALEIRKTQARASGIDAEIIGLTATERRIRVTAKRTVNDGSDVRIRVGKLGDEQVSRVVFAKIKALLPATRRLPARPPMMPVVPKEPSR